MCAQQATRRPVVRFHGWSFEGCTVHGPLSQDEMAGPFAIPVLLQKYPIFWTTYRQILVFWANICTFTPVKTQNNFKEIILASSKLYMFICKP